MKRSGRIAVVVGALLALSGVPGYAGEGGPPGDPFPPWPIPGINYDWDHCLWRINKMFDGTLTEVLGTPYDCTTGETRKSRTEIAFRLLTNGDRSCDEEVPGVPANLFLEAFGTTLHRAEGLAHFTGTVRLKDGAEGPILFEGVIELFGRIGTHQALGESCNEKTHIEGWIVARGIDDLKNYSLRAMVAAKATLPGGLAAEPFFNRLTGVIVKAP